MDWKYSSESVRKLIHDPTLTRKALRLFLADLHRIGLKINRRWYSYHFESDTFDLLDEEWDTAILIDAARPEFTEPPFADLGLDVGVRNSPASSSSEFLSRTFGGEQLHNTVYVTANPHVHELSDGTFHAVVNLLESDWNDRIGTVPPNAVVQKAVEAHAQYPRKRIIVHFMQPHSPFLGEAGQGIPASIRQSMEDSFINPWWEQMWGRGYERERLIEAFKENHEIVAEHVSALLEAIDGRVIITADHANLLGERGFPVPIRMYGHLKNLKHPDLRAVPWIVVSGDSRDIVSEPPETRTRMDEETIESRLASLGYR